MHQRARGGSRPQECPCHPQGIAPPTDELQQRCLEYLANFSNVDTVEAMVSDLRLGRTVKFRLQYKDACVRAIAKVPQSLFPLEPYAEYAAFEIDRLLRLHMVPPTTWIFVPLSRLETAAVTSLNVRGAEGGMVAQRASAQSGGAGDVHEYSRWVGKEVFMYAQSHNLLAMDPVDGRTVLGCSVQLWLQGVTPQHRTPLRFDDSYNQLLSASSARRHAAGTLLSEPFVKNILRLPAQVRNVDAVLRYLSDTYVFDSILGNDDRGSIKNSNAVKVVASDFTTVLGNVTFPASLGAIADGHLLVHLDQGKSFYTEQTIDKYLLDDTKLDAARSNNRNDDVGDAMLPPGVCMFRNETYWILKNVLSPPPRLLEELRLVLPEPILAHVQEQRIMWAQMRIGKIVKHIERCIAALGSRVALPWE